MPAHVRTPDRSEVGPGLPTAWRHERIMSILAWPLARWSGRRRPHGRPRGDPAASSSAPSAPNLATVGHARGALYALGLTRMVWDSGSA
jgi:hypothetical protein